MDTPETTAHWTGHLAELRRRVLLAFAGWFAATLLCYLLAEPIYGFLVQPLAEALSGDSSRRLIYTGLTEAFFTYLKIAFFGGFIVSFPFTAWQLYRFAAPGLYARERHVVLPFLVAAPVLFVSGAALAYYVVFPFAWQFFLGFETGGAETGLPIQLEARVSEYLSLVMQLILAFGIAFQLPVLLMLLARAGLVTPEGLAVRRKYALVAVVTFAAIITPPDVVTQIALAIPLYLLYEGTIVITRLLAKNSKDDIQSHA